MDKKARKLIAGLADVTLYYGYYGTQRFMTIQGSDSLEAGNRLEDNFRTISGERIHSIPMGNTSQEGYGNLIKAFNNQQRTTGDPKKSTGLSDAPAKRAPRASGGARSRR